MVISMPPPLIYRCHDGEFDYRDILTGDDDGDLRRSSFTGGGGVISRLWRGRTELPALSLMILSVRFTWAELVSAIRFTRL